MTELHAFAADALAQNGIRAVLTRYIEAWNRHEMNALTELLADDADWINIVGMHWRGKAAVIKGHEVYHRTIFQKTQLTITNSAIRAITPDVAVAVVTLKVGPFTPPDGKPRFGTEDRESFILVKRGGAWRITHGHNTVIDPNAQPFDPVNSDWNG